MYCIVCKAPGMCVCPSWWYSITLPEIISKQCAWSRMAFGEGRRTKGIIEHIKKELVEIEKDPDNIEEWIDVVILALDGAWRTGAHFDLITATLHQKMDKNALRNWPDWRECSEDQAIEHIK